MSKTPAQDKGIVKGKRYIVSGIPGTSSDSAYASGGVVTGSLVILAEDDESMLPYFDRISQDGEVLRQRCVIDLEKVTLTEVKDVADLTYSIDVSNEGTSVKTNKKLTFDQMQQIVRIIGAK